MKNIFPAAVLIAALLVLCGTAAADALVFPEDLTQIGDEAFYGVEGVEEAVVPAGVTRIGDRAFADSTLERIVLTEDVADVGEDAFPEWAIVYVFGDGAGLMDRGFNLVTCSLTPEGTVCLTGYSGSETWLEIPPTLAGYPVTAVGDGAFYGNTDLEFVWLPPTVEEIGDEAFCGCSSLFSPPELFLGLTSIGDRAFYGFNTFSMLLPRSLTHIGEDAFIGYKFIHACPGTYSYAWAQEMAARDPSVRVMDLYVADAVANTDAAVPGEQVTVEALFTNTEEGPEDFLSLQWQRSPDGDAWTDCEGAVDAEYTFTASADTFGWYRLAATDFTGTYFSSAVRVWDLGAFCAVRSARVLGTDVSLSWEQGPDGILYTLCMAGPEGTWTALAEGLPDAFFDVTGLEPETAYSFRVSAAYGERTADGIPVTVATQNYRTGTVCRALLIGQVTFPASFDDCPDSVGDLNLLSGMLQCVTGPDGSPYSYVRKVDLTADGVRQAIRTTFADADEDDISLFFIATHGYTSGEGEDYGSLTAYNPATGEIEYIRDADLAAWLSEVPGHVVVILEACSSGTAIQDPDALDPDAVSAAAIRAFRDADSPLALEGETILFTPEGEPMAELVPRTGALRQNKFHVLTSSAHTEFSYAWTDPDFPHTLFTYGLTLAVGRSGPMPCDTNGDGQASLAELQRYIADFHDPEYLNETQHPQAYPENSDYALFFRTEP